MQQPIAPTPQRLDGVQEMEEEGIVNRLQRQIEMLLAKYKARSPRLPGLEHLSANICWSLYCITEVKAVHLTVNVNVNAACYTYRKVQVLGVEFWVLGSRHGWAGPGGARGGARREPEGRGGDRHDDGVGVRALAHQEGAGGHARGIGCGP